MLADPTRLERRAGYADELSEALRLDLAGRFALAELWKDDENLQERLEVWLISLGAELRSAAPAEASQVRQALGATLRTLEALRRNGNARLAVEALMLDLPRRASAVAPGRIRQSAEP
jgi:hypothetical protein